MPGVVPLLSGLIPERALCRQARPFPPPSCHPGLEPGSRLVPDTDPGAAGTALPQPPGPRLKAGVTALRSAAVRALRRPLVRNAGQARRPAAVAFPHRHARTCSAAVRFGVRGLCAERRGQGRAVWSFSDTWLHPVMPGLVPGIHVLRHRGASGDKRAGRPTWMPGTSPGMTALRASGAAFPSPSRASRPPFKLRYKPVLFLLRFGERSKTRGWSASADHDVKVVLPRSRRSARSCGNMGRNPR